MPEFVGREAELSTLRSLTQKKIASMAVVTGRRRIGKSRLVEEFARRSKGYRPVFLSGLAPVEGVTDAGQREEFARQLQRELALPPVSAGDWADLFEHLARAVRRGRWIVLMDEISWMGSKDPSFLPKLKNAWDLALKKNPQLILLLCGSVSSWIDKNILSHTGFLGRISLRMRLSELPLKDCVQFFEPHASRISAYDKLKVLSVIGGVPRYLEEIIGSQTADENIARLCFQKEGLLFNEFDQIFSDLFERRSAAYKQLVKVLAEGAKEMNDIFDALGISKSGVVASYLDELETAGFVKRDYTWSLKTTAVSKKSRFRLSDNYVRFYLKHIAPNRSAIEKDRFQLRSISTLPGYDAMMGLAFENLVLGNRNIIWEQCGIAASDIVQEGPLFQSPTKRRRGCQVDYVVQTKHGPIYLCEIKMSREPITASVIDEVRAKIDRLQIPRHASVLPVLVHVNGVADAVHAKDYFARFVDFSI